MNEEIIQLSAPLELKAAQGETIPSQFAGVAYSGGKVQQYGALVVDLASTTVESDMPLLFQHRADSTIGVIKQASNDGSKITVSGNLFSDIDEQAKSVAEKSKRGLKYQMSIGIYDTSVERVPEGKTVNVNGKNFQGPITVLRNGTVREASIVALGADSNTKTKVFKADPGQTKTNQSSKEGEMPEKDNELINELKAENARLKSELQAKTELATELQAKIDKVQKDTRLSAVKDLFKQTNREFSEESAKPYMDMDETLFDQVKKDMTELGAKKTEVPKQLFQEFAVGEPGNGEVDYLDADLKARYGTN